MQLFRTAEMHVSLAGSTAKSVMHGSFCSDSNFR